jgi:hypothetical protein
MYIPEFPFSANKQDVFRFVLFSAIALFATIFIVFKPINKSLMKQSHLSLQYNTQNFILSRKETNNYNVFQKSLDAYTILDAKNPRFVEHSTLFKETPLRF